MNGQSTSDAGDGDDAECSKLTGTPFYLFIMKIVQIVRQNTNEHAKLNGFKKERKTYINVITMKSEMTCIVSSGALNSTHSLTHSLVNSKGLGGL